MKSFSMKKTRGFALGELLLAVVVIGVIAAVGYGIYRTLIADTGVSDLKQKTVSMVGKLREVYGNSGDFSSISATTINQLGAKPDTWRLSGSDLIDNMGNTVTINGTTSAFALMFPNLTKDNCASIASGLASLAYQVNVGSASAITAATGAVTGGEAYKASGGVVNPANLATGCGATAPVAVAFVFR